MLSSMSFSHLGYPNNLSIGNRQSTPTNMEKDAAFGPLFPGYNPVVSTSQNPLVPFYSHATAAAAAAAVAAACYSTGGSEASLNAGRGCRLFSPIVSTSGEGSRPKFSTPASSLAVHDSVATAPAKLETAVDSSSHLSELYASAVAVAAAAGAPDISMTTVSTTTSGGTRGNYRSSTVGTGSGGKSGSGSSWRSSPYSCDQNWRTAFYSNSSESLDLNSARRKNVTRESTATLKSWLQEHIKNPYPTKGEKIMLAIITKMTLTQVSTWFANARRRLKKENKMTWSPRQRGDDDDEDEDDDMADEMENGRGQDVSDLFMMDKSASTLKGLQSSPLLSTISKPNPTAFIEDSTKPRIWSLAMTATSGNPLGLINNNNNSYSVHDNSSHATHLIPTTRGSGGGQQALLDMIPSQVESRNLIQSQNILPFNNHFGSLNPAHV